MMVDLGALDGAHGRAEMKTARKLVHEGLAHAAASDIHRPDDAEGDRRRDGVDPQAARAPTCLDQMLAENTRRLLSGEMPDAPIAGPPRTCKLALATRDCSQATELDERRALFDGVAFLDEDRGDLARAAATRPASPSSSIRG